MRLLTPTLLLINFQLSPLILLFTLLFYCFIFFCFFLPLFITSPPSPTFSLHCHATFPHFHFIAHTFMSSNFLWSHSLTLYLTSTLTSFTLYNLSTYLSPLLFSILSITLFYSVWFSFVISLNYLVSFSHSLSYIHSHQLYSLSPFHHLLFFTLRFFVTLFYLCVFISPPLSSSSLIITFFPYFIYRLFTLS